MATAGDSRFYKDHHDRRRYNPYMGHNRRGDGRFDQERRGGVSVGGGGGTAAGGGGYRMGGGGRGPGKKWFKITILHGKKYDKKWLLPALQNLCSVPFTPIRYRVEGNKAQFLVDDATTANALVKVSRKITDSDGFRVILLSNPCNPPASILNYLKPEDLDHIKQCMSKRFDGSQQALDLSSIRRDRQLISQNIKMILNRNSCMQAVIKIIEESIPELICLNLRNNRLYQLEDLADLVGKAPKLKTLNLSDNELKSEQELDRVKGFKLTELWLTGNPLCDHFKDRAAYISAIQKRFPRLLKLDGFDLPAPIGFDLESNSTTLPPCKGSYFASDEIKTLISRFLQQYYMVYDSGDRQPLLDGYHDGAVFSLSIAFSGQNPSRSSLGDYYKDNRNIKSLKDPTTRFRLLKHRRLNVVTFLNELPKTQHDTASFNVDVNMFTNTLLSFTVSGVFKEVDGKSRDSVRAFSRVFITVPAANAGLCVVNDELTLRNATTEEIRRAFAAPAPTPSSSPVPTLTAPQQEMLAAFSQKSGMNPEWSQKCLQDNAWDFNRAAHIFSQLKAAGKIPEMAFLK